MADANPGSDGNLENKEVDHQKKRERLKPKSDYVIRKRVPPRLPRREKDVYVTNKSDFQSQLSHCEKLLGTGDNEVIIHGLGAAVTRAVNLALQLKARHHGTVDFAVNTSTVSIIDDLEPQSDQLDYDTQVRNNSSIHIKVRQIALQGPSSSTS